MDCRLGRLCTITLKKNRSQLKRLGAIGAEVKLLVDEDWQADRDNMLARLQHMRTKLFHQALKKGQLQTASQVLDSIGRVIGESVETVNIQAPELKISIEDKGD